jgi:hypothetical protein
VKGGEIMWYESIRSVLITPETGKQNHHFDAVVLNQTLPFFSLHSRTVEKTKKNTDFLRNLYLFSEKEWRKSGQDSFSSLYFFKAGHAFIELDVSFDEKKEEIDVMFTLHYDPDLIKEELDTILETDRILFSLFSCNEMF